MLHYYNGNRIRAIRELESDLIAAAEFWNAQIDRIGVAETREQYGEWLSKVMESGKRWKTIQGWYPDMAEEEGETDVDWDAVDEEWRKMTPEGENDKRADESLRQALMDEVNRYLWAIEAVTRPRSGNLGKIEIPNYQLNVGEKWKELQDFWWDWYLEQEKERLRLKQLREERKHQAET